MFWFIVFGVMLFFSISANLILLWIIFGHTSMRTVPNYFIGSLAIADLMMCVFNCAPNLYYIIRKDWIFGTFLCSMTNFMSYFTVTASVFFLLALTVERYILVMKPLTGKVRRRTALIAIIFILIVSSLLCLPTIIFSTMKTYSNGVTVCYLHWPDGNPNDSWIDQWYNIALMVLTYIIPMMVMAVCYVVIGLELWGGGEALLQLSDSSIRQPAIARAKEKKRKIVKMSLIVVILFAVSWFPYHTYFIITFLIPGVVQYEYIEDVYLTIYLLAMSTTLINPLVYYFINAKFRLYFHRIFFFYKHFTQSNSPEEPNSTTPTTTLISRKSFCSYNRPSRTRIQSASEQPSILV